MSLTASMRDIGERYRQASRRLEAAWDGTSTGWQDRAREHFAMAYMTTIEAECRRFEVALDGLKAAVERAERELD